MNANQILCLRPQRALIEKRFDSDRTKWDPYVHSHPSAALYHLSGWRNVIQNTYGHKPFYLMAFRGDDIIGILPLVHLKSFLFGNSLVSIPYFDMAGILANDADTESALLDEAFRLAQGLKAALDLRHHQPLSCLNSDGPRLHVRAHKVRMLLELPGSSGTLLKSFKAKLRNQIKKPSREGLKTRLGGVELIQDFYTVFSKNMRDLGSPVHSMDLIRNVMKEFQATAKIVLVDKKKEPVAAGLIIPFKDIMENPWASALREYSHLSPNMLLYWTMLEHACENGCRYFDFGRSTPGEGTFHFKEQWGAKPATLHWYSSSNGDSSRAGGVQDPEKVKFSSAIHVWKRLPVPLTRIFGPLLRKHISL